MSEANPAKRPFRYQLLTWCAVLLGVAAVGTLVPYSVAQDQQPNVLGYLSYCPFAPTSTLMLAIGAWLLWGQRQKLR